MYQNVTRQHDQYCSLGELISEPDVAVRRGFLVPAAFSLVFKRIT
jgi:hypothetical protein